MDTIRLTRIYEKGRYGIRGSCTTLLSPGITDILPGWNWLTDREHPLVEWRMSLDTGRSRNSFAIYPGKKQEQTLKQVAKVAFERRTK